MLLLLAMVPLLLGWVYQDTNGIEAVYEQGVAYVTSGQYEIGLGLLDFYLENAPQGDKRASAAYYQAKALKGLGKVEEAVAVLKLIVERYPSSLEAALSRCELAAEETG